MRAVVQVGVTAFAVCIIVFLRVFQQQLTCVQECSNAEFSGELPTNERENDDTLKALRSLLTYLWHTRLLTITATGLNIHVRMLQLTKNGVRTRQVSGGTHWLLQRTDDER